MFDLIWQILLVFVLCFFLLLLLQHFLSQFLSTDCCVILLWRCERWISCAFTLLELLLSSVTMLFLLPSNPTFALSSVRVVMCFLFALFSYTFSFIIRLIRFVLTSMAYWPSWLFILKVDAFIFLSESHKWKRIKLKAIKVLKTNRE